MWLTKIKVCTGPKCRASFSEYIIKRLLADKEKASNENIEIETCMCSGNCKHSPVIFIDDELHTDMNPVKASELVAKRCIQNKNGA